ncbi:MAG: hypothetical protein IVW57_12910 [Ktedonobacterales bacterium]|nr:hypothetical protein [Ktedonobacterales bacterium]
MRPGTTRTTPRRRFIQILLPLAIILALTGTLLQQRVARADASGAYVSSTTWPIVFVHGFNSNSSVDCGSTWNTASSYLQGYHTFGSQTLHWTGPMLKVGFYTNDTNCGYNIKSKAYRCTSYYASNVGTNNESIRHLACELAWYIYDTYSVYGQNVQVVAHSMGGLIIRWAIHGVQARLSAFPPLIYVQDVVTLSTPHGGVPLGSTIFTCGGCTEGNEMQSTNAFMNDTYNYAQDPQGNGWGTDWTMLGGVAFYNLGCDVVSSSEATYMKYGHKSYFTSPCYSHGGYPTDTSDSADARIYWCDGCPVTPSSWTSWSSAPRSLRHMLYALNVSNW